MTTVLIDRSYLCTTKKKFLEDCKVLGYSQTVISDPDLVKERR
jgi:hypothetical protein